MSWCIRHRLGHAVMGGSLALHGLVPSALSKRLRCSLASCQPVSLAQAVQISSWCANALCGMQGPAFHRPSCDTQHTWPPPPSSPGAHACRSTCSLTRMTPSLFSLNTHTTADDVDKLEARINAADNSSSLGALREQAQREVSQSGQGSSSSRKEEEEGSGFDQPGPLRSFSEAGDSELAQVRGGGWVAGFVSHLLVTGGHACNQGFSTLGRAATQQ